MQNPSLGWLDLGLGLTASSSSDWALGLCLRASIAQVCPRCGGGFEGSTGAKLA